MRNGPDPQALTWLPVRLADVRPGDVFANVGPVTEVDNGIGWTTIVDGEDFSRSGLPDLQVIVGRRMEPAGA